MLSEKMKLGTQGAHACMCVRECVYQCKCVCVVFGDHAFSP